MRKIALCAALALAASTPVLAQSVPVPAPRNNAVVQRDLGANSGPGGVGFYSRTGRPEDRIATDPAEGGNAALPERVIPNTGGGGGMGGSN